MNKDIRGQRGLLELEPGWRAYTLLAYDGSKGIVNG